MCWFVFLYSFFVVSTITEEPTSEQSCVVFLPPMGCRKRRKLELLDTVEDFRTKMQSASASKIRRHNAENAAKRHALKQNFFSPLLLQ